MYGTTTTSHNEKLEIYQAVSNRYREWYGEKDKCGGQCFYWSLTLMGVLLQKGYRALIQAGGLSWPIVMPGQDDGKSPTHFSYEWSPWREESQAALKLGLLPEILFGSLYLIQMRSWTSPPSSCLNKLHTKV